MTDDPKPEPRPDDRPRFFSSLNGWIAGLTGLVLATAGLFTAWDKLFHRAPGAPAAISGTATAPAPAAAAGPKADDSAPSKYTGNGGVTMEWNFEETRWELTDDNGTYYYDDVTSPDDTQVLGYDKTNSAYLRWPMKGGMAEESKDDRASWKPYLKLYPAVGPSDPTAN